MGCICVWRYWKGFFRRNRVRYGARPCGDMVRDLAGIWCATLRGYGARPCGDMVCDLAGIWCATLRGYGARPGADRELYVIEWTRDTESGHATQRVDTRHREWTRDTESGHATQRESGHATQRESGQRESYIGCPVPLGIPYHIIPIYPMCAIHC